MKDRAIELLKKFSDAPGVSGFEDDVRSLFVRELGGELTTDKTGSAIATRVGSSEQPRIMLAAHLDEVGFMVQSISSDGFLRLAPLGGWWAHTLPSQRVQVYGQNGVVPGVIAAPPVHFLQDEQKKKVLPLEKLFVDVGASSAEDVRDRLKINIGSPVVPDTHCISMRDADLLMGKAFDDRAGVALIVQALQSIASEALPNTVFGVGTVQEEVGVRGAQTAASLLKPDVAIVLEGTPADDLPGSSVDETQGKLGGGVQIRIMDPSAIMNRKLVELCRQTAAVNGISYQMAVRRSGGTDARAIHVSNEGVPTVVLGVPARYVHSHNSVICVDDYVAALELLLALLRTLDQASVAQLTNFLD